MKKQNLFKLIGASIMLVALASCGATSGAPNQYPAGESTGNNGDENWIPETGLNHKVIYEVKYTIYEDNFHKAASEISSKSVELDGYVVKSEQDNIEAHYTFKIPTENLNLFVSFVDQYHVGNKNIETRDITDSYDSTQNKIAALQEEKAYLTVALESSEIDESQRKAYTNRISEIDRQLSNLIGQKTEQDKLINYSNVYIDFYESKKTESDIYWDNYFGYMKVVGKGLGTVLLYSAPFALIAGVSIGVAYLLVKKKEK